MLIFVSTPKRVLSVVTGSKEPRPYNEPEVPYTKKFHRVLWCTQCNLDVHSATLVYTVQPWSTQCNLDVHSATLVYTVQPWCTQCNLGNHLSCSISQTNRCTCQNTRGSQVHDCLYSTLLGHPSDKIWWILRLCILAVNGTWWELGAYCTGLETWQRLWC